MSDARTEPSLRVTEIFLSLQGEALSAGCPTVFVRLTGCPLRCRYCDTEYAFSGGRRMTLDEIVAVVRDYGVRPVCVTGGEPLAQKGCLTLLERLASLDFDVSLETSGALDISGVDKRVSTVMDLKTPGSGESHRNRWENLDHLGASDQVKFVIRDETDYQWAREVVRSRRLDQICTVLFSPTQPDLAPTTLADWIVADRLPVRFQVQLHKLLWGDQPGR
ncbi:MAG TPA: 7-carboxy-7-deazaguanine synthase QueE [Gammaproteobacteria bacterium]|nr:7-carboxy-7-deazaguanine synthase QueE [Gammaproteobacteria bacterium]